MRTRMEETQAVTALLADVRRGEPGAYEGLFERVYSELRAVAGRQLARAPAHLTLQTTALVHEAYLRLLGRTALSFEDRSTFFLTAARAMRDILVERARRAVALKRGGGARRIPLEDGEVAVDEQAHEFLALSEAVGQLEHVDADAAQVVMLRFFSGLTVPEVASALDTSTSTVDRRWEFARAWLYQRLDPAQN